MLRNAINGYYNPKPPRPANVDLYSAQGKVKLNNGRAATSTPTGTRLLRQAAETPYPLTPALVVYITDGDPTAYDFDKPGDKGPTRTAT